MRGRSYTRLEVEEAAARNELPKRGEWCPRCRVYIPSFAVLSDGDVARIRQLRRTPRRGVSAIKELRDTTGCSMIWAKIWFMHPDGPQPPLPKKPPLVEVDLTECPECGHVLGHGTTRCWQKGCAFVVEDGKYAKGRD